MVKKNEAINIFWLKFPEQAENSGHLSRNQRCRSNVHSVLRDVLNLVYVVTNDTAQGRRLEVLLNLG